MTATTSQPQPPDLQDSPLPVPPTAATPVYQRPHRAARIAGGSVVGLLVALGALTTVPEVVQAGAQESYAVPAGATEVHVEGDVGEVRVREVATDQPTGITVDKHWSFAEPTARVRTDGPVATASLECPDWSLRRCYADWTVDVHPGATVVVRTDVGDISVTGVTGVVRATSTVGDIHVTGSPTDVEASTAVGSVRLEASAPPSSLRVRSRLGDIDVALPAGVSYDVRAESIDTPQVGVVTSPSSPHVVDVATSVGRVQVREG